MDRLNQLRGEAGGSEDSTLDTTSSPSEAYMSANDSSSKYFSLSDSTFDISPIKDVSLASASEDTERTLVTSAELIPDLSPVGKDILDSYKIGKQIEAANILSGGVDIFADNENSFDGDELVIDDNVDMGDKLDLEKPELATDDITNTNLVDEDVESASKDTEVVLQIDGKNVNAIDIGNGLYLYRKDGQEELAAVQIIDEDQAQPSFKFLKVRENAERNLEVYEEIEIAVPNQVPKEKVPVDKTAPHVPVEDINKVVSDPTSKILERKVKSPQTEDLATTSTVSNVDKEKGIIVESKEVNYNGKMMKINESHKTPVVGSFTQMTFHSTPNKEGIPLTKTMVDLQLDPNRNTDNIKKTIEVHTDPLKHHLVTESLHKGNDLVDSVKTKECNKEILDETIQDIKKQKETDQDQVISEEFCNKKSSPVIKVNEIHQETIELASEIKEHAPTTSVKLKSVTEKLQNIQSSETLKTTSKVVDIIDDNEVDMPPEMTEQETNISKVVSEHTSVPKDTDTVNLEFKINDTAFCDTKTISQNTMKPLDDTPLAQKDKNTQGGNDSFSKTPIPLDTERKECGTESSEVEIDPRPKVDDNGIDKSPLKQITKPQCVSILNTKEIKSRDIKPLADSDFTSKQLGLVEQKKSVTKLEESENFALEIKTGQKIMAHIAQPEKILSNTEIEKNSTIDQNVDCITESANDKITNASAVSVPRNTKLYTNSNIGGQLPQEYSTAGISDEKIFESKLKSSPTNIKKDKKVSDEPKCNIGHASKIIKPSDIEEANIKEIKTLPPVKEIKYPQKSLDLIEVPKLQKKSPCGLPIPVMITPKETTNITLSNFSEKSQLGVSTGKINVIQDLPIATEKAKVTVPKANPSETIKPSVIPVPKVISTETKTERMNLEAKNKTVGLKENPIPILKVETGDIAAPLELVSPLSSMSNVTVTANESVNQAIPISKLYVKESLSSAQSHKIIVKDNVQKKAYVEADEKKVSKDIGIETKVKMSQKPLTKMEEMNRITKLSSNQEEATEKIRTATKDIEPINKPKVEQKAVNNNHTAPVPFGKWTEVNRQEFLNKFKDLKAPISSTSKQIKNSNDLNKRDFLKKIDNHRQQTIINNANNANKGIEKSSAKNEIVFSTKVGNNKTESKAITKESLDIKRKHVPSKLLPREASTQKSTVTSSVAVSSNKDTCSLKVDPTLKKELSTATMASLIDRTIEDMITRVVVPNKVVDEQNANKTDINKTEQLTEINLSSQTADIQKKISKTVVDSSSSFDEIEMKMNQLHGIPFVERPPHELPKVPKYETKSCNISENILNKPKNSTTRSSTEQKNVIQVDSDDEVIEHEPITGDIELTEKTILKGLTTSDKKSPAEKQASISKDTSKTDSVITEKDFDKFARRNSVTYENRLTMNIAKNEIDEIQKEKDKVLVKPCPKNKTHIESTSMLPHKHHSRQNVEASRTKGAASVACREDASNKQYNSKIHTAYQSALTKRQGSPFTILEDKPVKVVFLESNTEFVPSQLNVQGQELSPPKKLTAEADMTLNINSVETLDMYDEIKQLDKTKAKHQRKQVLTPVEVPDIELIQPGDIGCQTSPKKKRKIEEQKMDKQLKNIVPRKSYLLGRNTTTDDKNGNLQSGTKFTNDKLLIMPTENAVVEHKNTASAIDNLVKAAELLDNQTVTLNSSIRSTDYNISQNTPVKRGRGRPRKYPLPDGMPENKPATPQKKPKFDVKPDKQGYLSDFNDSEEEIRENWTMGKINENIVCPICNKLFRSENVVFKHVKHCTGVSPNRSESDKSPRRERISQDFNDFDEEEDEKVIDDFKDKFEHTSKESDHTLNNSVKLVTKTDKHDVIVIEDTHVKESSVKYNKETEKEAKKQSNTKIPLRNNNLHCDICGKSFRQQSYLANHKLQHEKEQSKKIEKIATNPNKVQVFSCEICKKQFRKLHHLVQHRIIHDPRSAPTKNTRKTSSEQNDKCVIVDAVLKQNEDQNTGFRCEPCDKSFRKLHHLVEHRETHDGINRQKTAPIQSSVEKSDPPPQCEICKKTFRKLHHLIEHKEQHADTSSDKSDDNKSVKSVKSSLSTKDIIHECSSCYMVFPNEHSLNKHSTHCSKKKRQSKLPIDNIDIETEHGEANKEECASHVALEIAESQNADKSDYKTVDDTPVAFSEVKEPTKEIISEIIQIADTDSETTKTEAKVKDNELRSGPSKQNLESEDIKAHEVLSEMAKKISDIKKNMHGTPKKKTSLKKKSSPTVSKRHQSIDAAVDNPAASAIKPTESSDDDEIRYMLNPNYKIDDTVEGKTFMKVRANKRSSLQIERSNSKEVIRRTSLQHPPKSARLRSNDFEPKFKALASKNEKPQLKSKHMVPKLKAAPVQSTNIHKQNKEAVLSTDSDDSDIKYSFAKGPKASALSRRTSKDKVIRKPIVNKRRSLGGIAKRKSLGLVAKQRTNDTSQRVIKRRTKEVEHRCDCGALFGSAALLARHTSVAHTPPRVRRRRSPPPAPAPSAPPATKLARLDTKPVAHKHNANDAPNNIRKSTAPTENRKPLKVDQPEKTSKPRRQPVPDKKQKIAQKNKK